MWELLFAEFKPVRKIRQRRIERRTVEKERAVGLLGEEQNHHIFSVTWQPHRLWLINPSPQLTDVDRAPCFCSLPRKVVLPVLTKHEVCGVVPHLAQLQGIGDMPQQRT